MYAVCLLIQVGGKEVFKAHFVCRLHQQQLIEVLLLSVAGTWVLSRLYSFTLVLKTHGVYFRLLREFRGFLRMDFVRSLCAPSQAAQKFNEEMKGYIRTNYKRFVRSQESSKHHWVRDAAYASDTESDGHEHQPRDRGTIRFRADLDGFSRCGMVIGVAQARCLTITALVVVRTVRTVCARCERRLNRSCSGARFQASQLTSGPSWGP